MHCFEEKVIFSLLKRMKKIRFIFFFITAILLAFSVNGNESVKSFCPIEELAEDVEAGVSPLLKDVEDDSAYLKNSRRSSNNNDNSFEQKSTIRFAQSESIELKKKKKSIYNTDFDLWDNQEISFLHRFHLF